MKSYETTFKEVAEGHLVPSVIVSIADYETGKHKSVKYADVAEDFFISNCFAQIYI